jgi:hypothetical protein
LLKAGTAQENTSIPESLKGLIMVGMSFDIKKLDLDNTTVKGLLELLDALAEVDENDPANDENEYTISDNNGGKIELSVERGKSENVVTIRRSGLKLTLKVTKPKRVIRVVLKQKTK